MLHWNSIKISRFFLKLWLQSNFQIMYRTDCFWHKFWHKHKSHNAWISSKDFQLNCYSKATPWASRVDCLLGQGGRYRSVSVGRILIGLDRNSVKAPLRCAESKRIIIRKSSIPSLNYYWILACSKFKNWFHLAYYPCEKSVWKFRR